MTGFITAEGENYLLELISGQGYTLPSYFIALIRELPPTRHITGDELDEPTSPDYQRAYFENISGNWSERVQAISNVSEITFPPCESEAWGQVRYWALCDMDLGGRVLWAGSISPSIYVDVGDQVILSPGALSLRATGDSYNVSI